MTKFRSFSLHRRRIIPPYTTSRVSHVKRRMNFPKDSLFPIHREQWKAPARLRDNVEQIHQICVCALAYETLTFGLAISRPASRRVQSITDNEIVVHDFWLLLLAMVMRFDGAVAARRVPYVVFLHVWPRFWSAQCQSTVSHCQYNEYEWESPLQLHKHHFHSVCVHFFLFSSLLR